MDIETKQQLNNIETMLKQLLKQEATPEEDRDLVDIEQAALMTGLSVKTVYNYLNNGKMAIPYEKHSNRVMFRRTDLIGWTVNRSFKVVRRNGVKTEVSF